MGIAGSDKVSAPSLSRAWFIAGVFALLLVGAGTRFYRLAHWSYYGDEVFSLRDIGDSRVTGEPTMLRKLNPLGYLPIWLSHRLFGESEFASRLPSALFGAVGPALLALISSLILRRRAALLVGLLVLISPWHLFWSQMTRYYTMAFLLGGAGCVLAYAALERNSWKQAITAGFLLLACIGAHTTGGFLVVGLALYGLLLLCVPGQRPPGLTWRNTLALALPFLLVALAATGTAAKLGRVFVNVGQRFGHDPSQQNYGGYSPVMMMIRIMPSLFVFVGAPILLLPLAAIATQWRTQRRQALFWAAMIIGPLCCAFIYCFMHFVERRYLFISMSMWIVAAGAGLDLLMSMGESRGRWRIAGYTVLLLVISFYVLDFASHYKDGGRPNMRAALAEIDRHAAPGDLVVSNCMVKPSLTIYASSKPLDFHRLSVVQLMTWKAEKLSEHASDNRRTWYVLEYRRPGLPPDWLDWLWANTRLVKLIEQPRYGYMEWNLGVFVHEPAPDSDSAPEPPPPANQD
jgi:uncharacterized membrane protein